MPVGTRFAGTTGFAHSGRGAPGVSLFSEQQLFASAALSPAALHRGDRRLRPRPSACWRWSSSPDLVADCLRRSRPGPGGRGLPIRPPRRRDNVGSSTGADRAPRCIASNASVIKLDAPPDSAAGGRTLARPILGTRRLASPIEATRDGDLQDSSMGGTELKPVTPSLSIWCSRSRQFGGVRSTSIVERNAPRDRTPERTRTHDDPCHSCHATIVDAHPLLRSQAL